MRLRFLSCVVLLLSPPLVTADQRYEAFETTGTFLRNHDGDTITVDVPDRGKMTVRLSGADTPETGQAYWKTARDHLRSRLIDKPTTLHCYKKDRRQRDVCHVFVGDTDVALDLVSHGYAWYARAYARELAPSQRVTYLAAEESAQQQRLGLWAEDDPMPPGECRKLRSTGKPCR